MSRKWLHRVQHGQGANPGQMGPRADNPKVTGSNPTPATSQKTRYGELSAPVVRLGQSLGVPSAYQDVRSDGSMSHHPGPVCEIVAPMALRVEGSAVERAT